jgi:DNA-binding beta-propeller fold protein YncE
MVFCVIYGPSCMAVDYLYASLTNNKIVRYDLSQGNATDVQNSMQIFATTNLNNAIDLAFDSNGNLYAANYNDSTISKFDINGQFQATIGSSSGLQGIQGIALDKLDNLYVTNAPINKISKFDIAGNLVSTISSHLSSPEGIAIDASGNIYAANYSVSTVSKFDPSGNYLSAITSNLYGPLGLATNSSGYLYVANFAHLNNTISIFDSTNGYVKSFSTQYNDPARIGFDSANNIYVMYNNSNIISKYDSAGVHLFSWVTNQPIGGMVVVPEPSVFIMSICSACIFIFTASIKLKRNTLGFFKLLISP